MVLNNKEQEREKKSVVKMRFLKVCNDVHDMRGIRNQVGRKIEGTNM